MRSNYVIETIFLSLARTKVNVVRIEVEFHPLDTILTIVDQGQLVYGSAIF